MPVFRITFTREVYGAIV